MTPDASDDAKAAIIADIKALRAGRKDALRVLVEESRPALEVMIADLPTKPSPEDWKTSIRQVTETVALIRDEGEKEAVDRLKDKVGGRITVLRQMVERESDSPPENPVAAVLTDLRFFRIVTGRVFTALDGEAVPVDSESFGTWVSQACHKQKGIVVGKTSIEDATRAVVGVSNKLPVGIAPVRYAYDPTGKGIRIDLADAHGRYVHVTALHVTVEKACPVTFYRPAGTSAMPVPSVITKPEECAAVLADYWRFLVLDEEYRASLFAFLMSGMRPMEQPKTGIPHPLHGGGVQRGARLRQVEPPDVRPPHDGPARAREHAHPGQAR